MADDATLDRVIREIQRRWKDFNCKLCGQNDWTVVGHVSLSVTEVPARMVLGGDIIPLAAVSCQRCGNTVFLNEVVLGVVPSRLPRGMGGDDDKLAK